MRGVRGAKERRNEKRKSVSKNGSRGSRPREAEGGAVERSRGRRRREEQREEAYWAGGAEASTRAAAFRRRRTTSMSKNSVTSAALGDRYT